MYQCERDLLTNLIVLSSRCARKEFRQHIFKAWDWKCAYCNKDLNHMTATIDHIVPKFKGGQNIKSNMCCCCSDCNKLKASTLLDEWYTPKYLHYCRERLVKIKAWMVKEPSSLKLPSFDKYIPCTVND